MRRPAHPGPCAVVAGTPNTVWCWGASGDGQLAQGDTAPRQYPIQVLGLTSPTKLAATDNNSNHSTFCALDGDNVRCWGYNGHGAAGANTTTSAIQSPMLVVVGGVDGGAAAPLTGVVDVEGGWGSNFATLQADGTLWTWGNGATYASHATTYGMNIVALTWAGPPSTGGPLFLTGDGAYHDATSTLPVNCGLM